MKYNSLYVAFKCCFFLIPLSNRDRMMFISYNRRVLLTVDIGTSIFKSALWDFEGNRVAFADMPLSINPGDGLRHEAQSGQWLKAFCDCCCALGAVAPLASVEALVVSGNGPSLTPVFGDGEWGPAGCHVPAAPARLWLDRRGSHAAELVSAFLGGFVDASFFLPKALDIKLNDPHI
ncbi:MAG: hypothetical protein FWD16_06640, partial [Clostridia bacterium]|nr:hypothetical protein [Clostridia bacterium]